MARRGRIIIVANRLPVHRAQGSRRWAQSPGGLVTALEPILRRRGGVWVGWTGAASARAPRPFRVQGLDIRPVPLSAGEVESFYHGLSNRTLWPLYHDAIRTPEFRREWWWPYVDVNRRFAEAAAEVAGRGDTVWIHDYHLQLVPRMLREMRPDLRTGFFLHIPFPPEELFAWLPWRRQILEGLLGADLVGFQTYASAQNFSRAARSLVPDTDGTDTLVEQRGHRTRVGSFPISIDFDWFNTEASSDRAVHQAGEIRRRLGAARRIVLSVDRLDYTKGIDARLLAFEELLRRGKASVDDCVMVQIAVPSRELVADYADMRTRIEQIVGRINGEFAEPGRVAVHYFRRSYDRADLVAWYRAADVMLVTPLRDGMNLVAKEFVACKPDLTGTLVLSEFAGAARELRRAFLVNPRDADGMVNVLDAALRQPEDDARHRMAILRMVVRRHDVNEWAANFLGALAR